MTIAEARAILEKSEEIAPSKDEEGRVYYSLVGDFYEELGDGSYGFIVYPYTSEEPIDKSYAFVCYVSKDTGEVGCSTAPLSKEELKQFNNRQSAKG